MTELRSQLAEQSMTDSNTVNGKFVDLNGERFYAIENVDNMAPFFTSMVSDSDHWLFASSTGGLTAGRVSPETALFPYVTVDRIHESPLHTGCKTLFRVGSQLWEPLNREHDGRYALSRNLYKSVLGNKLCFEEINHDLKVGFRYTWMTSQEYGFVRRSEVFNLAETEQSIAVLDGLQNILPAGTPRHTQTISSNLVDAYKFSELVEDSKLALFSLYSGITDRAEPCESLRATTLFANGWDAAKVILNSDEVQSFKAGMDPQSTSFTRGIRGAYLLSGNLSLAAGQEHTWDIVANLEQSQSQAVALLDQLQSESTIAKQIQDSIDRGTDALAKIMASADGMQCTEQENVSAHHYANVLFNVLRGGIFENQYHLCTRDFSVTIKTFNKTVFDRHQAWLAQLPPRMDLNDLMAAVVEQNDPQLTRLSLEYLPITFGRRHGDPSRPWNQFAINLTDEKGEPLLFYQGNWRDIFQNWEALTFSYPQYVESVVAKFVNASTVDGYNPYRITKQGIDWEVEEPDDPWSYIGYWGDHQIIYLLKMLELSKKFHPQKLSNMLHESVFSYANVPYRIRSFDALVKDAKNTVDFDEELAHLIDTRVAQMGSDGKLVLDGEGQVYQVNLLEKLIVPLLCKLGNLVVDGGIWLNAQRPEWNDANNALVGQGLSMVTLYYMRRYIDFMQSLLSSEQGKVTLSNEVATWLDDTTAIVANMVPQLKQGTVDDEQRMVFLQSLGLASSQYRKKVYQQQGMSGKTEIDIEQIKQMLSDAQVAIDHSIRANLAEDGLYHAYNLLDLKGSMAQVDHLYPMLEGQVALLSSGAIAPEEAVKVLESLFNSDVFRADQHTFMLYPDRMQTRFLDKNKVPEAAVKNSPMLMAMIEGKDKRIITQDARGQYRFNPDIRNAGELKSALAKAAQDYDSAFESDHGHILATYESVFNHQAFTGRSGGMFGFEGLGCIYWHMVAKLLLAVAENFYHAIDQNVDNKTVNQLGDLYYRVRKGIGFNKTPEEYGAFPTDPYSHTPKHAGAQQPGMTGQVKEEVLSRFAELGVHVQDGAVRFLPALLKGEEFLTQTNHFKYLDIRGDWQTVEVPARGLAFSWCQVPIIYQLSEDQTGVSVLSGSELLEQNDELSISSQTSEKIFNRTGEISLIKVNLHPDMLFGH